MALSFPALTAFAATPMLTLSGTGNGTVSVQIAGGEPSSSAVLYYYSPSTGQYHGYSLGTTNASGVFTGVVDANVIANLGANMSMPTYVQVGGYESARVVWPSAASNTNTSGGITFSQSSPVVMTGQSGAVTLSGGSGTYYVASNSNANGITPSISGNVLTLYGVASGSGTVQVCSTGGGCGNIAVTVNTTGNTTGGPVLSASSVNVAVGSQASVVLSGGSMPYNVSVASGSGISTTLIGNTLYITGTIVGTSNLISVCSANSSTSGANCTPLWVNVQAQTTTNTNTNTPTNAGGMSFVAPIMMGQTTAFQLSGGIGSYYIQSPVSSPAFASISGNSLMLNASSLGTGVVTVCQTGASACLPVGFTVTPASQPILTGTGGGWLFDFDLSIGMSNQDVLELQKRLMEGGYFTATPTGYFGSITASAVMRYQSAHGISTTGYVGPLTRARLNQ